MHDNLYLMHHGVKGMKWGIRRYQNEDGSLTEAGKKQYGYGKYLSKNTKSRLISGAKIGAKVGTVPAAYMTLNTIIAIAQREPMSQVALGASLVGGSLAAGTLLGAHIGTIAGMAETHAGRNYMRDQGIEIKEYS